MQPHLFKLSNGLRVILIDTKAFPTVTTLLLVGAGSRYENEKNNGIAHFVEHMVFKGSKKYPNFFAISSLIEGLGAVSNAYTSKDHVGYWIKSTTEHFPKMLDLLADVLLNPLLEEEEIEREKGVIIEEMNMYEDTPYRRVGDYYEELLYKGNPLGFDIIGTKETVTKARRETFLDYMRQLYHPDNAVLVVAGGLGQIKNYLQLIEEKFAGWQTKGKGKIERVKEKQNKPALLVKYKKTEQAHFCLGFRTFSFFDERKYGLSVLTTILGGGASSRLFIEVRERRGLCYYISTHRESYHDVGNMVTQAGVPNNLEKTKEAVRVTLEEHKKIITKGVGKDELKRAKELIKGRLYLGFEDSFNIASFYGNEQLLLEKMETPEKILEKIEKVTEDDLTELAKEFFMQRNLNFALIGPFEKNDFSQRDFVL